MREQKLVYRTEKTYLYWIRFFIRFHRLKHPEKMGVREVDEFLSWLAVHRNVSPGTQAIALNSLIFLYQRFYDRNLDALSFQRARTHRRIPTVLTHEEAIEIIGLIRGVPQTMVQLMYGSGLRQAECCSLRIKDINLSMYEVVVRSGKGGKDRRTVLPKSLRTKLSAQIETVRNFHAYDITNGHGEVYLPEALARKYPNAARETKWQFLFPARYLTNFSVNRSLSPIS